MSLAWLYTPRGGTGYRNQGPDPRAGGLVGRAFAWTQRTFSFHSAMPPYEWIYRRNGVKLGAGFSRPLLLPWLQLFIPHRRVVDRPRWWSFRIGWRFDRRWDETPGRGGYFPDVIVKADIDNLAE